MVLAQQFALLMLLAAPEAGPAMCDAAHTPADDVVHRPAADVSADGAAGDPQAVAIDLVEERRLRRGDGPEAWIGLGTVTVDEAGNAALDSPLRVTRACPEPPVARQPPRP